MAYDWMALGREIKSSRVAQGMTQDDLASQAQVSRASVQNLERGAARHRVPTSLKSVTDALGWSPDRALAVLQGQPDVARDRAPDAEKPSGSSSLPLRVAQELAEGPLLDATVFDLPDSDARMVVVVKGKSGSMPDELRRDLLAWIKAQQVINSITDKASGT